ncbi:MAG: L-rhamnose isomerase, partial [Lachnospiraceae bacterium]|nr:L-rhamnose isomerase [Lachnospiraceae bacterium]
DLKQLQDSSSFTELMVRQEEQKTLPFGEIWNEYCRRCGVPEDGKWFSKVQRYEIEVLEGRA